MKIDTLNPYTIKILIAARKIDSISAIAKRINVSYGWTHKWVSELMKEGVFREQWRGVTLQEKNRIYREIVKFIKKNIDPVNFYYSILPLLGINYCFTKTDAVYIWTEGRYNIARYKRFYPIFIKIKKADYKIFLGYCKKLQLKINARKGVFYVPEIVEELKCVKQRDYTVESLDWTISFMKENIYNFEPALEMIGETYHKNLHIKYKEMK